MMDKGNFKKRILGTVILSTALELTGMFSIRVNLDN